MRPRRTVSWSNGDDWGSQGNDGVANLIPLKPRVIVNLGSKYPQKVSSRFAILANRASRAVCPSVDAVEAAKRNRLPGEDGLLKASIVDRPRETSCPIGRFTDLPVYREFREMELRRDRVLHNVLVWTISHRQTMARGLYYASLREPLCRATLQEFRKFTLLGKSKWID